ncbi:hypothetical protein GUJ93_ZPchr0012g21001 [Zizania palustris]|uniref:Exocyst subunit Exo70 family protein n=1 Tax=Zizania palustris TaxID=103762 RepID=A0A8J5WSQ7_ZIZPA|nr:hypothetical protein GUJ93_ZPchr0012g21001 [Zizania palustris]
MDSRSSPAPHKSSSFSPNTTTRDDSAKLREVDRNLSLGAARQGEHEVRRGQHGVVASDQIKEECEEEEAAERWQQRDGALAGGSGDGGVEGAVGGESGKPDLAALSVEIDAFIAGHDGGEPVDVSGATLDMFASAVELEIARSESAQDKWATDAHGKPRALLASITRIAALAASLAKTPEGSVKHTAGAHRVTAVLNRAMAFLEDEFHALLEDPRAPKEVHDHDRCVLLTMDARAGGGTEAAPPYPPETVDQLRSMADALVTTGYVTEYTQMFLVARRNAFDASLRALGYEKTSIDDVVKMTWEALDTEIATWIKAFRHTINVGLSTEHDLCSRIFTGRHAAVGRGIFADLSRCVMLHMLNFTEAVTMTKHTAEKLFKVLDMYEAIRDASPVINAFLSTEPAEGKNSTALTDLKAEINAVRSRLGESAATIFREFESSIRADAGKQPVPGGAVHPLTRYVMNYLKSACEYNSTLEQVFRDHHRHIEGGGNPFAAQLMEVMELLQGNLEGKSRLYKDPSLSNIFLMNNGRYMLQKIRGSPATNAMLGETWARQQSTNLRQYHKNYQRETWNRVLAWLRDDGVLTVKGSVQKPVLKDRFKHFNAAMDEIHRTQGAWVVSDEQLKSELRVSIAAVVVPAYRSFLGRFAQTFSAGRQTEKYVKLSADDVETIIDELFDGNASSMARRRT